MNHVDGSHDSEISSQEGRNWIWLPFSFSGVTVANMWWSCCWTLMVSGIWERKLRDIRGVTSCTGNMIHKWSNIMQICKITLKLEWKSLSWTEHSLMVVGIELSVAGRSRLDHNVDGPHFPCSSVARRPSNRGPHTISEARSCWWDGWWFWCISVTISCRLPCRQTSNIRLLNSKRLHNVHPELNRSITVFRHQNYRSSWLAWDRMQNCNRLKQLTSKTC